MRKNAIAYLALCLLLVCLSFTLSGCGDGARDFDGKVKVIYQLEGGIYQNCEQPIIQYYGFDDEGNLIVEPSTLSGQAITRSGYTLEGWYREKSGEGNSVSYSDKWDFTKDKVSKDGVTLYARWKKNILYTYEVCYRDEQDQSIHTLGSYEVNEGDTFNDYYASYFGNKRIGYTALNGLFTEGGEPWDKSFTHPGGETDTAVRVFINYIEGDFVLVDSPRKLLSNKSANLYLTADIDFEGDAFSGFGDYKGIIKGNGFTVRNFSLSYDNSKNGLISDADLSTEGGILSISLFRSLKGAEISDITFSDFTVDIKAGYPGTKLILVAPLAMKLEDSKLSGVSVEGATVTCSQLPTGFDKSSSLVILESGAAYFIPEGDTSELTDVTAVMTDNTDGT
ncbi:MAG: InlB B-repeat-containing protein [Clostridia bacterium]|nr:InlB B-repeat-containing protein [Clostridia bacterium]